MAVSINNGDSVLTIVQSGGRPFKLNPCQVISVSFRTDRYFVIHTSNQEIILDVSVGCSFIQDAFDETVTSARYLVDNWVFADCSSGSGSSYTFLTPLSESATVVSLLYDAHNLKVNVADDKLNTIQDIATTDSPTFNNLLLDGYLQVNDDASNYIRIVAPSAVTASYTVTLPTTAPGTDTFLKYDGGSYVWASLAGGHDAVTLDTTIADLFQFDGTVTQQLEAKTGLAEGDVFWFDGTKLTNLGKPGVDSYLTNTSTGALAWTTIPAAAPTYNISAVTSVSGGILRLTGPDDVLFASGSNISVAQTDANTITISHSDTSSQVSIPGQTGATIFNGVTLDSFGHVQSLTERTLTLADLGYTAFDLNFSVQEIFQITSNTLAIQSGISNGALIYSNNSGSGIEWISLAAALGDDYVLMHNSISPYWRHIDDILDEFAKSYTYGIFSSSAIMGWTRLYDGTDGQDIFFQGAGDGIVVSADSVTNTITITGTWRGIDDTPVNGQTAESISSNWAFGHAALNAVASGHLPILGTAGQALVINPAGTAAIWDDVASKYLASMAFGTGDGVLTATMSDATTISVDLDGRYLQSYTEADTLDTVSDRGATTNQILNVGGIYSPSGNVSVGGNVSAGGNIFVNGGTVYLYGNATRYVEIKAPTISGTSPSLFYSLILPEAAPSASINTYLQFTNLVGTIFNSNFVTTSSMLEDISSTTGDILYYNGSAWVSLAASSGSAGDSLVLSGGVPVWQTVGSGGTTYTAGDGLVLNTAEFNVDVDTHNNLIFTGGKLDTAQDILTTDSPTFVNLNLTGGLNLTDGTDSVHLTAPADVVTSGYTITFPAAAPSGVNYLESDASGNMSWKTLPQILGTLGANKGDILWYNGTTWTTLGIGSATDILTVGASDIIQWTAPTSGTPYTAGDGITLTSTTFSLDLHTDANLVLTGTSPNKTLNTIQGIKTSSSPTFANLTLGANGYVKVQGTSGSVSMYAPASGADWSFKWPGSGPLAANKVLLADASANMSWSTIPGLLETIGSTLGNILYYGSEGWVVLAPGSDTQILTIASNIPSWANPLTYSISAEVVTGGANLQLSDGTTNDSVKFASGTGITVTRTDANTITIASSATDTNTTYSISSEVGTTGAFLRLTAGGSGSGTDDVEIIGDGTFITSVSRVDANTIGITGSWRSIHTTATLGADTVSISSGWAYTHRTNYLTGGGHLPAGSTPTYVLTLNSSGIPEWMAPAGSGGGNYYAGDGITIDGSSFIHADINTTNLKFTDNGGANEIDTIQSIAVGATPEFNGIDLTDAILLKDDFSKSVTIAVPSALTNTYTITLPAAEPASNTFLKHTTTGTYVWAEIAGATPYTAGTGLTLTSYEFAHADTSTQTSSSTLTGAYVFSQISLDGFGHLTSFATRQLTLSDLGYTAPTISDATITISATSGLATTGSFTLNQAANKTITLTNTDKGSSQNIFKNILVSGQNTVVADDNNDSLTLVAGAGISIITDSALDKITFANTGVTSVVGTTNQINVSGSTGAVTFSLPQSIATNSDIQFGSVQLNGTTSGYITLAPSATTTSYTLTFPDAAPGANTYLKYNGSAYVWAAVSGVAHDELTLDSTITDILGLTGQVLGDSATATTGDIMYHNGTKWTRLAKGADTEVLTLVSGLPSWETPTGGGTTYTAGTGLDLTTTVFSLSHLGLEALTDPGGDKIFFWDESANAAKWLTVAGSGGALEISGTILQHYDTSTLTGAQGGTGIASITVDGFGHITAVTSANYITTSHVVNAITSTDISNWNTAYEWGDNLWRYSAPHIYPVNITDKVTIGAVSGDAPLNIIVDIAAAYPSEARFMDFGDGTQKFLEISANDNGAGGTYTWIGANGIDEVFIDATDGKLYLDAATDVILRNDTWSLTLNSTGFIPSTVGTINIGDATNYYNEIYLGGTIKLIDNSQVVGITASPTASASYTLTLPAAAPAATQILQSDASGVLSWIDTPAGGSSYNYWVIKADAAGTTNISTTDQLEIAGGTGITTALVGNTLTVTNSSLNTNYWAQGTGFVYPATSGDYVRLNGGASEAFLIGNGDSLLTIHNSSLASITVNNSVSLEFGSSGLTASSYMYIDAGAGLFDFVGNIETTGVTSGATYHTTSLRGNLPGGSSLQTGVQIHAEATENWALGTNYGSKYIIKTVATGAATPIERLSILGTGAIRFNDAYTFPIADGTASYFLQTNGSGTLSWASALSNPMTAAGDIIYGGASGSPTALVKGTAGQVLTMNSGATAPEWATPSGGSSFAIGREITTTDDLEIGDVDKLVYSSSATDIDVTIPEGIYATGDVITLMQTGNGIVTIVVETPANMDITGAASTSGVDSTIAIVCLDDTAGSEVWKIIGGVV